MRPPKLLIGILILAEVGNPLYASAMRRTHRPWLMIGQKRVVEEIPSTSKTALSEPVASVLAKKTAASGDKIAQQALRYRGTKYRFGGTTQKGLDCSGLVDRIYADLKLKSLPRTSKALYEKGKPVHLAELRPGDLVFFKNTYRRGISHVGIYAGSNRFVHASNHRRGVTVTSLSDPYYQLHYAGARRLY